MHHAGTNLAIACVGGLHASHSPGLVALCKDSAGSNPALVGGLQARLLLLLLPPRVCPYAAMHI